MASQPANTAIKVYYRVRAQRNDELHTSVKHRASGVAWNNLNIVPPGEEILVYEKRDTSFVTDAFRFGHPVTVLPREKTAFADIVSDESALQVSGLSFPITFPMYPRDKFIEKTEANVGDDLHQDVRDSSELPRGLFEAV
jgi:hypothetical protein